MASLHQGVQGGARPAIYRCQLGRPVPATMPRRPLIGGLAVEAHGRRTHQSQGRPSLAHTFGSGSGMSVVGA